MKSQKPMTSTHEEKHKKSPNMAEVNLIYLIILY